jgi:hypothetical protein
LSRYKKIDPRMYGDKNFRKLSPIAASGQSLWTYLLTGPHSNSIPGLFCAGRAGLAEALGWNQEDFDRCFTEIESLGMVEADWKARVVSIPNAIKYNPPESPNVVKSWQNWLDEIPECELKDKHIELIIDFLEDNFPSCLEAIDPSFKASSKASRKASVKPSRKPLPNQEQEQEQDLNKKGDHVNNLVDATEHEQNPPLVFLKPENQKPSQSDCTQSLPGPDRQTAPSPEAAVRVGPPREKDIELAACLGDESRNPPAAHDKSSAGGTEVSSQPGPVGALTPSQRADGSGSFIATNKPTATGQETSQKPYSSPMPGICGHVPNESDCWVHDRRARGAERDMITELASLHADTWCKQHPTGPPTHDNEQRVLQAIRGSRFGFDACIAAIHGHHKLASKEGSFLGRELRNVFPEARINGKRNSGKLDVDRFGEFVAAGRPIVEAMKRLKKEAEKKKEVDLTPPAEPEKVKAILKQIRRTL